MSRLPALSVGILWPYSQGASLQSRIDSPTMRFLSPILCLSLASIVSSNCPDDHGGLGADKEHSCAPTPSYCTIKCPKDGVCTFVNVDGNGDEDAEAGGNLRI